MDLRSFSFHGDPRTRTVVVKFGIFTYRFEPAIVRHWLDSDEATGLTGLVRQLWEAVAVAEGRKA